MRVLITGGSACGKSTFAEQLALELATSGLTAASCQTFASSQVVAPHQRVSPCYYLATMRPVGDDSLARIARHRHARAQSGFTTIERDVDIATIATNGAIEAGSTLLLECLCNLTANELFDSVGAVDPSAFERIMEGLRSLEQVCGNLIVVTNDVGSGSPTSYSEATLLYVETLGRLNATLAAHYDAVYELVCGIPLPLKRMAAL